MPWTHHALALEESDKMAEALGRFREVAGTVPSEPRDIALLDNVVHRAEGSALPVQPSGKLIPGTHRALDMTPCIPFLVEEGSEVVHIWSQGTTAQAGNHLVVRSQQQSDVGAALCQV